MKHYLSCLVFLSVLMLVPGCGGGDDDPVADAGERPPSDGAMPVPPDANPNSDINPPLTPDDPCRQLKKTFDFPVIAADMAVLGKYMIVTYLLETGTQGLLVYENEELIKEFTVPGQYPALFYARDEVHMSVVTSGGLQEYRVSATSSPVDERHTFPAINAFALVADRTAEDDLLILGPTINPFGAAVLVNTSTPTYAATSVAVNVSAAGWYPGRYGEGAQTTVPMLAVGATQQGYGIVASNVPLVTETPMQMPQVSWFNVESFVLPDWIAMAVEAPNQAVAAMEQSVLREVQYVRLTSGATVPEPLRKVSATLATNGAHVEGPNISAMTTYFVEQHRSEDLMSSSWVLVNPVANTEIAVGRSGLAGNRVLPGSLLTRYGKLFWAGPTIQDGNTPNYPADAIAVCTFSM